MRDVDTAIQSKRDALEQVKQHPAVAEFLRLADDLHTLERARALLTADEPDVASGSFRRNAAIKPAEMVTDLGRVDSKTSIGMAVAVLRELGKPAHANEIFEAARKDGLKSSKSTMISNLARFTKAGKIFYRTKKRNTFGLLEWQHRAAAAVNAAAMEHEGR